LIFSVILDPCQHIDSDMIGNQSSHNAGDNRNLGAGSIEVNGKIVWLTALPEMMTLFLEVKKPVTRSTAQELLKLVKSFNTVPEGEEDAYVDGLLEAYRRYLQIQSTLD
jgi:hypothetical protein